MTLGGHLGVVGTLLLRVGGKRSDTFRVVHVQGLDDLRGRADHARVVGMTAGADAVVHQLAGFHVLRPELFDDHGP